MESLKVQAKKIVNKLPYPAGKLISYIPFRMIFGKAFDQQKNERAKFDDLDDTQKKIYSLQKMQEITSYAYHNILFYQEFYKKKDFHPNQLKKFKDIQRIPILTKDELRNYQLKNRSAPQHASEIINTGGTSGEPLEFYIEQDALAREWSHMMHIWSQVDYKKTDLKLNFRGRNIGKNAYQYNPVGNEYIVNTYFDVKQQSQAISQLLKNKTIRYLHGYPSAIYEFAKYIAENNTGLLSQLNKSLKGILLGSEYPAPVYRETINRVFDCPNISWYGHSEMCILAYEKNNKWEYEPMGSYGYCEAIPDNSDQFRLIGTSYYNTASPFIRYDTGDLVSPIEEKEGLLKSFKIERGRVGEFVVDKNGNHVSLTSLIFGRHHHVFGKAKFVQVSQSQKGEAQILITKMKNKELTIEEVRNNFDSTNVNLDFVFKILEEPYRSQSGKVPLLVREI